jgi:hypothetical protein
VWARIAKDDDDGSATKLWSMGGRSVRLYRDEYHGSTTISYYEVLPREFPPLLVLDASGELRETYKVWAEGRKDLELLPTAERDYSSLTIHHLNIPSGLEAHRVPETRLDIVEAGIAAHFETGGEPLLNVVRKGSKPS